MKKHYILIFLITLTSFDSFATHTKGGWMYYEYMGPGTVDPTKNKYRIVLKMYLRCDVGSGPNTGALDPQINFTFFNGSNNQFIENVSASLGENPNVQNCPTCNPCIVNSPTIC